MNEPLKVTLTLRKPIAVNFDVHIYEFALVLRLSLSLYVSLSSPSKPFAVNHHKLIDSSEHEPIAISLAVDWVSISIVIVRWFFIFI